MTNCLNCENIFEGNYCNLCGQKASTHRFTMHEWLHEIPHSIFHVDSGFFATLTTLFRRPGEAIREYLEGKRKLLFSPFLYVLIMCGVFVVAGSLLHPTQDATQPVELKNLAQALMYIETRYYKVIVVAMILPTTLATFLAYYRAGYNFAEHLVLNAYLIGQLVIADLILALIRKTSLDENYFALYGIIELALKFPYWFWVYWQFFKPKKWYWGVLNFLLAQIITAVTLYSSLLGAASLLLKFKGGH